MVVLNSYMIDQWKDKEPEINESIDIKIAKSLEHPWLLFKACLSLTKHDRRMGIVAFGTNPRTSTALTYAGRGVEDPSVVSLKIPESEVIASTGGAMTS